jgi:3-dehydroquinate synthetase
VGAFYNPKGVIIDTDTLNSLPEREFKSGLAEVVKYGLIQNKYLLSLLKENSAEVLLRKERIIQEIICESIKTKSKIVIADEKENGLRAILNFGHTFGHAIEANGEYKKILHGEAVAKGMLIASRISFLENLIPLDDLKKIELLLKDFKFDLSLSEYQYSDLKPYIYRDKKVKAGKLNLILLEKISKAKITNTFNPKNLSKAFAI